MQASRRRWDIDASRAVAGGIDISSDTALLTFIALLRQVGQGAVALASGARTGGGFSGRASLARSAMRAEGAQRTLIALQGG